ncbi:MAG: TldD/PmbA family protein [bacterium]
MGIEETAKRLLGLIEKAGADEGEVFIQKSKGLEINLRDQEIETLRNMDEGGFGLRLISGGRLGFVHSSDLRDEALEESVEQAVALAKESQPDEANRLPEPSGSGPEVDTYDGSFGDIAFERKLALLRDMETLSFAYDPAISRMESVSYDDGETETVVANTHGVFTHGKSTHFSCGVSVMAERDGEVESGGESTESRYFENLDPPSRVASRACWKATSMLGAKTIPSQDAMVIFDRDVVYAILRYLFTLVDGSNIADGLSLLEGRMGEKVASDLVTVVDDATIARGVGSRGFDAEGIPSRQTVILQDGVLTSFVFDSRSARKAGATSTANARRAGFRGLPGVGSSNLYIQRGGTSPEKIMESTDKGLWLMGLAGWWTGINPSTGGFSSGAKGLWIEGGEVAHPVRNVTVASNIIDMLKSVDLVGDDLFFRHAANSPTLRISEMSVGGA